MKMLTRLSLVEIVLLLLATFALAKPVHPQFDLDSKDGSPFPTDRFTVEDKSQLTGLRVNLPMPSCVTEPSECADISILNTLDGFNPQPRLSIPFDGAIDLKTVSSKTVFLLCLGRPQEGDRDEHCASVVGINQIVWDPVRQTLHAESDDFLDQHTRYALVVTEWILGSDGDPIEASKSFRHFFERCEGGAVDQKRYCRELRDGIDRDRFLRNGRGRHDRPGWPRAIV
jgi:hypothetical protein